VEAVGVTAGPRSPDVGIGGDVVPGRRHPGDWRVLLPAAALFGILVATSGRYGFHRDEMYFIVAGSHPAWGYPDQPPLVPLLCAGLTRIFPGSLLWLRLPGALASVATVVTAAAVCRELGGTRRAQLIGAWSCAVSLIVVATGHFVTTTTFDVLSTTVVCWLVVRAFARHNGVWLAAAGAVTGVAFEAKPQVGLVAAVLTAAIASVGPRWPLRSPWTALGAAAAAALAAPYLWWQAAHGWPQITVAGNIAGSAELGRPGFVPFQLVMVGLLLVPVWVAGLVSLLRGPALRTFRFLGVAYVALAVLYVLGDGKAYYLASMYPALLAAGAIPVAAWSARGRRSARRWTLVTAIALSAAFNAWVGLPVQPEAGLRGGVPMALNPDLGETVGWPSYVDTVRRVWSGMPVEARNRAVVLTSNYGEAAALTVLGRFPPDQVYSGHDGFWFWGPPRARTDRAVLVGNDAAWANHIFSRCRVAAVIRNPAGVDNDEEGQQVRVCRTLRGTWSQQWPWIRHFD
jgi:dolichyl-phosphate-mannose-protein mannosyltransferase